MNDVFNAKRFLLLFRKTIAERPLQTLGVIVLLLVLSLILYVVVKQVFGFGPAQNLTFIWGLAGGGFFLSSFIFSYFGTNASGSSYLTLPVSFFEKWLCGIIIVGVIYPLLFLLFFHLMDVAFVDAYHGSLDPQSLYYKQQLESVYPFSLNNIVARKVYSLFLQLAGCMLTGSLYFNKTAFIKTGIAFCILVFLVMGLNWLIAASLFRDIKETGAYDHVTLFVGKETGTLLLPSALDNFFHAGLAFVLPIILWFMPLLRLREKEF